jgi:hypothetical protein
MPSSPSTRKITIGYKEETQRSRKLIPLSKRANLLLELGPWPKKSKNVVFKMFNKASPKCTNSSSFKPQKDSKSASARLLKDSKVTNSRPPRDSNPINSKSPKDFKFASYKSPRDSNPTNSRSPKDSKFASSRPSRDFNPTNSRSPKDSKSSGKVEKFRTRFQSRKHDGGGKRSGDKLNVVGFR